MMQVAWDDDVSEADIAAGYLEFERAFVHGLSYEAWEMQRELQRALRDLSETERKFVTLALEIVGWDSLISHMVDEYKYQLDTDKVDHDLVFALWREKHPRDVASPKSTIYG
jgi:hypothetical protein